MYIYIYACIVLKKNRFSRFDGHHQRFTQETRNNSEQAIGESKLKPSFIMSHSSKVMRCH